MFPAKPIYNPNSHVDYRQHVWREIKNHYDVSEIPARDLNIIRQFCELDLSMTDKLMQDRYSLFGPSPRQPSSMLRSMLLSAVWGVSSYTEWAHLLKTIPMLAIVSGFMPNDVPGVGTFYDFMKKLWLSDSSNFSADVRPKRKKPSRPSRKGEKAAPVEKKPVEDLIQAFQEDPGDPLGPCRLLWEIFACISLNGSIRRGLLNPKALVLAGDGTPLRTGAQERTKPACSCLAAGSSCDRFFQQPDCDWGYDSHRRCCFYGYHLYLLTDPSSKHDLPIFPYLGPASRHDSHGFVHTWFAAKSLMPDFQARQVPLDAAHDAIYELLNAEGAQPVIDLNKGHSTTLQQKGYSIGPDGIPVCRDGHRMHSCGFDAAQHRLKYRCPKISRRNGEVTCECSNPCSTAKYGRQVHVYPRTNPRLFCVPARGSEQWKTAYSLRTGSERANKRIKMDYKLEDGRYRSSKAWYCRLFIIMMQIHHDARPPLETTAEETDRFLAAA